MHSLEDLFPRFFSYLQSKGPLFNVVLGLAWSALFGALDELAPQQYNFSFLYLLPIAFVTWFSGKRYGFLISLCCAGLWSIGNFVKDKMVVGIWNISSTFAIFIAVSVMLSKIHQLWENDIALARTDPLTGVINIRALADLVNYEILRFERESSQFSFAYLDIDNFKYVNDNFGHKKGDEVLKAVTSTLQLNLRKTDIVARVGGDEFTVFLPGTDDKTVHVVMEKVIEKLNSLAKFNNWPISYSIGVVTCNNGACKFNEILSKADDMMYKVKKTGKNNISFGLFEPE